MKQLNVAFMTQELKEDFHALECGRFEDKQLHKAIESAIERLKRKCSAGIKIPTKIWPEEYIKKYGITNLWKFDLPNAWRLLYTIESDDVMIVSILLEWFDHKDYEKKFKY